MLKDVAQHTDTRWAPWRVIDGNDEAGGAIAALTAIADALDEGDARRAAGDGDMSSCSRQRKSA